MEDRPVYLDYNATTPVDPEVVDAMMPWFRERFGNPSSGHFFGWEAQEQVEAARTEMAVLIGAKADEIVFTGSATEANNLAILGSTRAMRGEKRSLVTSVVEHPSVLQPFLRRKEEGWRLILLPVDSFGRVDLREAESIIGKDTALVSVMLANNETGTIQPVREIAGIAHSCGALFHVDAAQAIGKIPVDVEALGADLLTLAGHKFYAPKGIGVLYVREGTSLSPLMSGAGHERGLRPGTENVPYIAALGTAARLVRENLREESARIQRLRERLHGTLSAAIDGLRLNGPSNDRLPNTLNLSFPHVKGWELLAAVPGIAASTGSACHWGIHKASPVLLAMQRDETRALGAVRLSLGRFTDEAEVDFAASALISTWHRLSS
nr:cysteine desulfurase family protein [Leptospirillum ferrooxidans]